MIDREKYLARQARYNASEKGRARWRDYENRRYAEDSLYRLYKTQSARWRRHELRVATRLADDLDAGYAGDY